MKILFHKNLEPYGELHMQYITMIYERSKKANTQNMVVNYRELNEQQRKCLDKVQAMIIVVNQNEFMATMCYLKPPNEHSNILYRSSWQQ